MHRKHWAHTERKDVCICMRHIVMKVCSVRGQCTHECVVCVQSRLQLSQLLWQRGLLTLFCCHCRCRHSFCCCCCCCLRLTFSMLMICKHKHKAQKSKCTGNTRHIQQRQRWEVAERERSEKECVWESGSEAGHRCVIGKATEINKILRAIYVNEKKERQNKRGRERHTICICCACACACCVCVCLFMRVLLFFFILFLQLKDEYKTNAHCKQIKCK